MEFKSYPCIQYPIGLKNVIIVIIYKIENPHFMIQVKYVCPIIADSTR